MNTKSALWVIDFHPRRRYRFEFNNMIYEPFPEH